MTYGFPPLAPQPKKEDHIAAAGVVFGWVIAILLMVFDPALAEKIALGTMHALEVVVDAVHTWVVNRG